MRSTKLRLQSKLAATAIGCLLLSCQAPVPAQTSALTPVTAYGAAQARTKRKRTIITDSLWGNLILEFAYDNDPTLRELGTATRLMNMATSFGLGAIAGGTLFQGIYIMSALNPGGNHQISYVPGITGIVLSSATLATIFSRQVLGHELTHSIRKRQFALADKVENLLGRLEDSHCTDPKATSELTALIGQRPAIEWMQMWRATHKLSTEAHRISMDAPKDQKPVVVAESSKGGM